MIGFKPTPPSLSGVRRFDIALLCFTSLCRKDNIFYRYNKILNVKD